MMRFQTSLLKKRTDEFTTPARNNRIGGTPIGMDRHPVRSDRTIALSMPTKNSIGTIIRQPAKIAIELKRESETGCEHDKPRYLAGDRRGYRDASQSLLRGLVLSPPWLFPKSQPLTFPNRELIRHSGHDLGSQHFQPFSQWLS
jgi:hypothetical protein